MNIKQYGQTIWATTKSTVQSTIVVLKDEYHDNVRSAKIVMNKLRGKEVNDVHLNAAMRQIFKDNTKLLVVGIISILPGSVVTLPIIIKSSKKLGIDLIPNKTFK